jgi:hypothetical protein
LNQGLHILRDDFSRLTPHEAKNLLPDHYVRIIKEYEGDPLTMQTVLEKALDLCRTPQQRERNRFLIFCVLEMQPLPRAQEQTKSA